MEIKKGDILLVHSYGIMGRIIQFGMNLEKWLRFDFKWHKIYNHAAIAIQDGVISEALAKGITPHTFEKAYGSSKNKELVIYRPDWTEEELWNLPIIALEYDKVNYQFLNFIQYIPKIFLGVWLGRTHKKSQNKLYCTEYVGLVVHRLRNYLFKRYWRTSPNDIGEWCVKECKKITEYKL